MALTNQRNRQKGTELVEITDKGAVCLMNFLGVRFTTKEERKKVGSPWQNLKKLFSGVETSRDWSLQDSANIFDITNFDELEATEKMIQDFRELTRPEFYQKYQSELSLQFWWNLNQFEEMAEEQLLNTLILRKLAALEVLFHLHWGIDIKKDQLFSLVNQRLHEFYNESFWLDEADLFPPEEEWEKMSDTQVVKYMIERIDAQLSTQGFRLVTFEVTDQEEYIGVFFEDLYTKYFKREGGREKAYRLEKPGMKMEKMYSLLSIVPENQKYLEILENDFAKLSKEEFYQKYEELIHPVWDEESFYSMAGIEEGRNRLMTSLTIHELVEQGELLVVDWSGEENDNEVTDFINERLEKVYQEKFTLSATKVYEEFARIYKDASLRYEADKKAIENRNFFQKMLGLGLKKEDLAWTGIKRGDHLPILFAELSGQLEAEKYSLVCYDQGHDAYYLTVLTQERSKELKACKFIGLEVQVGQKIQ